MNTKKEVTETCSTILDVCITNFKLTNYKTRGYYIKLYGESESFIKAVLDCHPDKNWTKEVVGVGVGPNYGMFDPIKCRSFVAIFDDGSFEDFSFHKCIRNMTKDQVKSLDYKALQEIDKMLVNNVDGINILLSK